MAIDNPVPISPALQKSYRDTMLTPTAPSYLDPTLPIQPVAVIANTSTAASTVQISDGTDTANVTTQGGLQVSPNFSVPSSSQTIVKKSNTKSGTTFTAGTGINLYTVTASKTFYMTHLFCSVSISNNFDIRDSSSVTGTPIICGGTGNNTDFFVMTFPTPIPFTTGVWFDSSASNNLWYSLGGWEE